MGTTTFSGPIKAGPIQQTTGTDLEVVTDFVAGTEDGATGAATATVLYIQNNNLS